MFTGVPQFIVPIVATVLSTGCGGLVAQGGGGMAIAGSAAGTTSIGADGGVQRCQESLGTLAVDEGRDAAAIEPLLRLAAQQSNCFVITSVGSSRSDQRMTRITNQQRGSDDFRQDSRQEKGQRVAADYYVEPAIVIHDQEIGKIGGGVGQLLGPAANALATQALGSLLGSAVGGAAGFLQAKSSVVTLSLYDIRSQVQVSASEGSATTTNIEAALAAYGGTDRGLGAVSASPEGKATAAAFLDAYNKMVLALKDYRAQEVRGGLGRGGTLAVN